ncbi:MAG: sigma 54-interacting transcriptional regulator [Melioribacteraceae bacterium]|nr:sigma 54-interacting transcriptional regulator [Melioribacteraceae bacterium]
MSMLDDKLKDRILDSIAEGVFTVDKDFRINFFNKAAEKITGQKREEVLGKFCKNIFKSPVCLSDCPIALVLKTKKSIFDYESKITDANGKLIPIKLNSAILFDENNFATGGIVTFRDLSQIQNFDDDINLEQNFFGIIGHSKEMKEIFNLITEIATSDAPVFIRGESGTGKELIANAIQKLSNRKDKPFIKINCSVFPSNLLASELFGHIKGAFTDAVKDRPGRFELADKGTIFLDEVAEMPLQMQIQLLRVLQEGTFERIGESLTRTTDVRIIAATNIDINLALKTGKFREDLFYRLNVIPIEIPPLRERKEDIPLLVKHFIKKYSRVYKKEINDIEPDALGTLIEYDWKGNVRELENVIEYALVRTNSGETIQLNKLPNNIVLNDFNSTNPPFSNSKERTEMLMLLEKYQWNRTKVAEVLGIGRTTLWRKLKKLNIIVE